MDLHLNLPQARAHQVLVPGRSVTLPWSRGVGKSWFQRVGGWYLPISQWDGVERPTEGGGTMRGIRIVHIQPTFKSCKDVHKDSVLAELEGQQAPWAFLGAQIDHTAWQFRFPGGSWIKWFGAKAAQSARGIRCDAVTIDEGDDVDPSVYDAIIKPWFSEPWSLRMILLGGTPRRGRYGLLHREHRAGLDGNVARLLTDAQIALATPEEQERLNALRLKHSFHATWRDAPKNVDAKFVAQTKASLLAAGQKAVYQREWECDFDSAEGLVYSHFNEGVHVRRAPPAIKFTEYLIGIDHGWEDPGVILVVGVAGSGAEANLYLLEEVYESHQMESWWIERCKLIKARYSSAPQRWYADPSRPDRVAALARGAKITFADVDNAIEDGVSAVAEKLALRVDPDDANEERQLSRLYIDPSCKSTLYELVNYRRKRDPQNADRFLDDIVDKDNHCLVAGTLVTTNAGPLPIEQVPVGAHVLTRLGWRDVTASGMTFKSAAIHRLMFDGGVIEGTGDHPVWTANRGWVRLDALRYGDMLLGCEHVSTEHPSPSFSTALPSDATPTRRTAPCVSTSWLNRAIAFIGRSGSTIMGRSPRGITSTTWMRTPSTTTSATWSASSGSTISAITGRPSGASERGRGSARSSLLPRLGTEAPRGEPGTANTAKTRSRAESPSSVPARSAATSSRRSLSTTLFAFARTTARALSDALRGSTTSTAPADGAAPSSASTSTTGRERALVRVESCSPTGEHRSVYDLTVDGAHEFFANGVLVHNSMDALRYPIFNRFGKPQPVVYRSHSLPPA